MITELSMLVLYLKNNPRFELMKNRRICGSWTKQDHFYFKTELESDNLRIIYMERTIFGSKYDEEITLINKKKENERIKNNGFTIKEIKDYINKNA